MAAKTGTFVWHDLMTADIEKAKVFYTGLLGWNTEACDFGEMGTYEMIEAGEEPVGGYMKLDPAVDTHAHWLSYVAVEDVDRSCSRAVELGGKVRVPPTDIPDVGRFAIVEDPQGGLVSPFQCGDSGEGEKPPCKDFAGRFVWNELLTPDPGAAAAFYTALFDWGHKKEPMGDMEYHLFLLGEEMVGGMMKAPGPQPRPHWMPYIAVENVDASAEKALSSGAEQCSPPMDIPGVGRFSVLKDPTGAPFALFKGE